MKTIDINLIGNEVKQNLSLQPVTDYIDEKTKTISKILLLGTCIVFVISAGIWTIAFFSASKVNSDLTELKQRHEKLQAELATSASIFKDLQKEKKILELKLLIQKEIDNSLLPWHDILVDIANTVPKDVKVTKIVKIDRDRGENSAATGLNIEGEIALRGEIDPLETISYFVLNINENHGLNSNLTNAVVKSAKYDDKTGIYNFVIETTLKLPEKKVEQDKKEE